MMPGSGYGGITTKANPKQVSPEQSAAPPRVARRRRDLPPADDAPPHNDTLRQRIVPLGRVGAGPVRENRVDDATRGGASRRRRGALPHADRLPPSSG